MEDFELDEEITCPKCGHSPTRWRRCSSIHCQDGMVDESEEDFMTEGTVMMKCLECNGTGIERWCPQCSEDLNDHPELFSQEEDNEDDLNRAFPFVDDDDGDDEDNFQPCDECDLPDACADFGCAIKQGIKKPISW